MELDMRVCPKCGDTLHPLAFTHHVKKCNGTRTNYNILTRSKTCSICGVAKRDELNLPAPVRRRIIGKRAPGHVKVVDNARPIRLGNTTF